MLTLFALVVRTDGCTAAAVTPPQDNNVFTLKLSDLEKDTRVNTWSPYYSAIEAAKGFEKLPSGTKGTFIYTGNAQATSVFPVPLLFDLSIGKAASYYLDRRRRGEAAENLADIYSDALHNAFGMARQRRLNGG